MTSEYTIIANRLRKVYRGVIEAVRGVSFRVKRGEVYGLLGPNGAGKTTTLGMLTTVIKPTSGDALVAGYSVTREPAKVRSRIGVVFQEPTVDRELTAWENIYVHGLIHGIPRSQLKARIPELLKLVELEKYANMQVKRFSGGMIRRLEIARALVNIPDVLFLDEPTIGLDPHSRSFVWSIIRRLKKEGVTIFLTTHYMEEADALCDRIAIIDHGVIIAEGPPEELKSLVGGDVVYVEYSGDDGRVVDALKSLGEVRLLKPGLVSLRVKSAAEVIADVVRLLDGVGVKLRTIKYSRPSLEDVFLHLTGRSLRDEEGGWREVMRLRIIARMRR